jgi:chromosome segregation ATPase
MLEDNGIDLNQLDSVASDIAVYCYKNDLSVDRFIQIAVECLNLSSRLRISILGIPDYIIKGKEIIDNFEKQRQGLVSDKQRQSKELDTLTNKINEYGKEKQLIEKIEELNRHMHKKDEEISHCKEELEFKTNDVNRQLSEDIMRLVRENARKDFELKTARHHLSQCQKMMIKLAGEDHARNKGDDKKQSS